MFTNQAERPRFYQQQYLGAEDLMAIVSYSRRQHARHVLGGHTWGIALGLQLKEVPDPAGGGQVEVYLQPGYAWDGIGRPVLVLVPRQIPAELFKSYVYDAAIDGGTPEGRLIEVWLRYDETVTQSPRPGFEVCDIEGQFSRVQETFRLEVGERRNHLDRHDPISVAGYTVDAQEALQVLDANDPLIYDESIPHQAFPEDRVNARWLIPLGYVRWKPNPNPNQPGYFVEMTPQDREASRSLRRYIGVVAEGIQAVAGLIRLRDRTEDPAGKPLSNDLVWVEGDLRVDENIRLFGSQLEFLDNAGQDNGVPLVIERIEDNGQGRDLRVLIGQEENGDNRFVVGPEISNDFVPRLVVRDDGHVGVEVESPEHNLQIGDASIAISLSLRGPDNDPESSSLAFEDDAGTAQRWFKFIHDTQDDKLKVISADVDSILIMARTSGHVGIGATELRNPLAIRARGTSEELVSFEDPTGRTKWHINQNLGGTNPGLNIAETTVADGRIFIKAGGNVGIGRTNPDRKLHVSGDRIRLENGGKRLDLRADGSEVDLESTTNHLYIRSSGPANRNNVIINPSAGDGNVGIGTTNPSEKLDVRGKVKLGSSGNLFALGALQNLRAVLGRVNSDGTVSSGVGFSVSRIDTGEYRVAFTDAFDSPPIVLVTPSNPNGKDDNTANTFGINANEFRVVIMDINENNFTEEDADFDFMALGGVS